MKKIKAIRIILPVLLLGSAALSDSQRQNAKEPAQAKGASSPASGNVETLPLTSKVFDNTRTIRVLLPPDYHDPKNATKRYPVIYLTDGIMVFRRFNLEETVHRLIKDGVIRPIIVVGVDNGAATDKSKNPDIDRANEYLPYPDVGFPPDHLYAPEVPNPRGKLYPEFLVEEVMPLIRQRYRVKAGASNTSVGGFSYGGVAALYTVMSRPGVFGKLLLESTPLWIGPDRQLLKDARRVKEWPKAVYVGVGTKESPDEAVDKEGMQDRETLQNIIRAAAPKTDLKSVREEGAKHESSAWSRRLPAALQFLFGLK